MPTPTSPRPRRALPCHPAPSPRPPKPRQRRAKAAPSLHRMLMRLSHHSTYPEQVEAVSSPIRLVQVNGRGRSHLLRTAMQHAAHHRARGISRPYRSFSPVSPHTYAFPLGTPPVKIEQIDEPKSIAERAHTRASWGRAMSVPVTHGPSMVSFDLRNDQQPKRASAAASLSSSNPIAIPTALASSHRSSGLASSHRSSG